MEKVKRKRAKVKEQETADQSCRQGAQSYLGFIVAGETPALPGRRYPLTAAAARVCPQAGAVGNIADIIGRRREERQKACG